MNLCQKYIARIFTEKNLPVSSQQCNDDALLAPSTTSTVNIVSGISLRIDSELSTSCSSENDNSVPASFGDSFTSVDHTASGDCNTDDPAGAYDPDQLITEPVSVMDFAMVVHGLDQSEPVLNGHHTSGPQTRYTVN